jgi:hypothetical protein
MRINYTGCIKLVLLVIVVCVSLQKAYEVDVCAEFVHVYLRISAPKEMDEFLWNA